MNPPTTSGISVRSATLGDLPAITDIYNEAILTTTATFDTETKTLEQQRAWFAEHSERYPIVVAEVEGEVRGWASVSPWSDRCAYSFTAEESVYVAEHARGKGIGRLLLAAAIELACGAGLHTLIARIADGNPASFRLHESLGFEKVGIMREVGRKFGKLLDVHILQIMLD